MNQQLDDSKESVQSQSLERYLQVESTKNSLSPSRPVQTTRNSQGNIGSSILKLQHGKFSNSQAVFQEALIKKKTELTKKPEKQLFETPKKSVPLAKKQPQKFDKVQKNIKETQKISEEVKKKREDQKKKEEEDKLKQVPQLESDEAFLETVNRLYDYDRRRVKQLEKMVEEEKVKETKTAPARPIINQKSCILLDRKLKQLAEEDEEYKKIYLFKEISVQVDLLPNLPMIKRFQSLNKQSGNSNIEVAIEENKDDLIDAAEDVQYKKGQEHKSIQTNEIKYKVGDTIKKQQQLPIQQEQVKQFQEKETPKKNNKVINQREKRQEIMETQGQRVKTECQYYIPLHLRQQQVIQKKEEWVKQQRELKKQQIEEEERLNRELWEQEKGKWNKKGDAVNKSNAEINVEEFVNEQLNWLEKRNDSILTLQMKKDKEMLQGLTFKPKISKRSNDKIGKEKVEDRLLDYISKKEENLQKLENKYLPTFQPNLESKSFLSIDWGSKSFSNASLNKLWS